MENSAAMPAAGGVMKEVLSTPFVKDIIRSNLNSIKPDKSHPLVMALIWQDPEIILSILGTIPPVVNSCVGALAQTGKQVNEKLSPEMIRDYFASILKDIDTDEFKALAEAYTTMMKNLWEVSPEFRETCAKAIAGNAPPLIGKGINKATRFINEVNKSDPQVVSKFVSDVVANVDVNAFRDATHTIANAFLDQKLHLIPWAWQLIRKRMKRRK